MVGTIGMALAALGIAIAVVGIAGSIIARYALTDNRAFRIRSYSINAMIGGVFLVGVAMFLTGLSMMSPFWFFLMVVIIVGAVGITGAMIAQDIYNNGIASIFGSQRRKGDVKIMRARNIFLFIGIASLIATMVLLYHGS